MTKYFSTALKEEWRESGTSYEAAATAAGITSRQLARQVNGQTKTGMMPLYILLELIGRRLVSKETAREYVKEIEDEIEEAMQRLNLKRGKTRRSFFKITKKTASHSGLNGK